MLKPLILGSYKYTLGGCSIILSKVVKKIYGKEQPKYEPSKFVAVETAAPRVPELGDFAFYTMYTSSHFGQKILTLEFLSFSLKPTGMHF
jgi:hypothetical protein